MANLPENFGQEFEQRRSRRSAFKWIGQVAAGASLAGVGIEALNPLKVFAAGKTGGNGYKAGPNGCTSCYGCNWIGCDRPSSHCSNSPSLYYITWTITDGCVPNCSTSDYAECSTTCHNPC